MKRMTRGVRALLSLVDIVYAERGVEDSLTMLPETLEALRKLIDFSSAVYLPIDPQSLSLQSGHTHDADPALTQEYLGHYQHIDPFVIEGPCLKRPQAGVRLSDFCDVARVFRSEFGDFMLRVPYRHILATILFDRGLPVGALALHRRPIKPDFDADEALLFSSVAMHIGNSRALARIRHGPHDSGAAMLVALVPDGQIVILSDSARACFETFACGTVLPVPAPGARPVHWGSADRIYRVHSRWYPPGSLMSGPVASALTSTAVRPKSRLSFDMPRISQPLLAVIEPLPLLESYGLSPREIEIVRKTLDDGYTYTQLAQQLGLARATIKEHWEHIFFKVGVKSYKAFVAKVLAKHLRY